MSFNLPARIEVVEVAPRDGFQSFGRQISTGDKLSVIQRLLDAGLRRIEVTGFANRAKIPQFADAETLCAMLPRLPGVCFRGMAPNARGARRAVAAGIDEVVGLITASGAYLRKNQNMSFDQAIEQGIEAFLIADGAGRQFTMAMGLSFWCAYEGLIPDARVIDIMHRFHDGGVRSFYLAATVGLESPDHVYRLLCRARHAFPDISLGFHVHNLGGRAPALTIAALQAGIDWIEGAICGIGGGIAMPESLSAVGNYATEDLVTMLSDCGIETGLDPAATIAASRDIAGLLGIRPQSFAGNGASRLAIGAMLAQDD